VLIPPNIFFFRVQTFEPKIAYVWPQGNEFTQFGRCVAMDLMRYCQSFQIMAQGGGDVLSQLLTKWSTRFEEKCARDPYWWLKAGAE
jgi:hypothetical protein